MFSCCLANRIAAYPGYICCCRSEVKFDVIIYGSEKHAEQVNEQLTSGSLFLQRPQRKKDDFPYHTPQSWDLAAFDCTDIDFSITVPWLYPALKGFQQARDVLEPFHRGRPEVTEFIDHHAEHRELVQADVDDRIKTPLLK